MTTTNRKPKIKNNIIQYLQVWTPYGGWWVNPPQWKRNTGMAGLGIAVVMMGLFKVSASKERRPIAPYKQIPSQSWCKFAKEDDPRLKQKLKKEKNNELYIKYFIYHNIIFNTSMMKNV